MSSQAPEHAATNPQRRTEINVPQIPHSCPDCQRRQELMLQLALVADAERMRAEAEHDRAEAFKRLYESALIAPAMSKAA